MLNNCEHSATLNFKLLGKLFAIQLDESIDGSNDYI